MADTYTSLHYHIVFSTKNREPWLSVSIRDRLWPYIGGIARENKMCTIEIGGVTDHIHALVRLSPAGIVSKAVQLIKGGSSFWIKTQFPNTAAFGWQDGYGAFTVSASHLDSVQQYIRHQAEHHRTTSFVDEYRELLERNGVEIDERYWLG